MEISVIDTREEWVDIESLSGPNVVERIPLEVDGLVRVNIWKAQL